MPAARTTAARTIADRFLAKFGPNALCRAETGMPALKWLNDNDPRGVGQMLDGAISYRFTDGSTLLLYFTRTATNH